MIAPLAPAAAPIPHAGAARGGTASFDACLSLAEAAASPTARETPEHVEETAAMPAEALPLAGDAPCNPAPAEPHAVPQPETAPAEEAAPLPAAEVAAEAAVEETATATPNADAGAQPAQQPAPPDTPPQQPAPQQTAPQQTAPQQPPLQHSAAPPSLLPNAQAAQAGAASTPDEAGATPPQGDIAASAAAAAALPAASPAPAKAGPARADAALREPRVEERAAASPLPPSAPADQPPLPTAFERALTDVTTSPEPAAPGRETTEPATPTAAQAAPRAEGVREAPAPTPAAARAYPPPAATPAQQIAPILSVQAGHGTTPSRIVVALRPDSLGQVEVALEAAPDRPAQLHILVERPETLLLLQRDRGALEAALQAAGFETRPDSVTLGLSGGAGQDTQRETPRQHRTPGRGHAPTDSGPHHSLPSPRPARRGLLDLAL